jgi:peptide-methionine (S)-S-oxide reductase
MSMKILFAGLCLVMLAGTANSAGKEKKVPEMGGPEMDAAASDSNRAQITLAGGCFWCLDAVFEELAGITEVESGYSGGTIPDPTYRDVCTGETGHAEVVQLTFDPAVISLDDILRVFFTVHDPTTLNRQGADVGTQYRSAIFFRDPAQKQTAERIIGEITDQKIWDRPIVTQLAPFETFYRAEEYHQGYYANNARQPYCQMVIAPKVAKFREHFRDRLKKAP